jgi:hypothetical protein
LASIETNGDLMPYHPYDAIVFDPRDVDLSRSPLAGQLDAETYCLGAFNPGLTRLPNGNLLLMVRIAEALRRSVRRNMSMRVAGTTANIASMRGRSKWSIPRIRANSRCGARGGR